MSNHQCQLRCWPQLSQGNAPVAPQPLRRHVKLFFKRRLSPATKRKLKNQFDRLMSRFHDITPKPIADAAPGVNTATAKLNAGDFVRVRSRAEIEATLNRWGELKGCAFMPDMAQYCHTCQRVLKPVERFLDERDYRVKKCNGLVLLEGLICPGLEGYGRCDRACFYFWREEWLEKIG